MITDVIQSAMLNAKFDKFLSDPVCQSVDTRLNMLTGHFWSPVLKCHTCLDELATYLPNVIPLLSKQIVDFYHQQYSKRKLSFCVRNCWVVVEMTTSINPISKQTTGRRRLKKQSNQTKNNLLLTMCQLVILFTLCKHYGSPQSSEECGTVGFLRKILLKVWNTKEINRAIRLLLAHKILKVKDNKKSDPSNLQSNEVLQFGFGKIGNVINVASSNLSIRNSTLRTMSSRNLTPSKLNIISKKSNLVGSILNITTLKVGSSLEMIECGPISDRPVTMAHEEDESSQSCLDAALMRVMKEKKRLLFDELVQQTVSLVLKRYKRNVSNKFVGKRAERLVELNYLGAEPKQSDLSKSNIIYTC